MSKVLLALTLITALSAPAFAESEKTAGEADRQQAEQEKAPAAQANDPNWHPCNYSSERDPNGCE